MHTEGPAAYTEPGNDKIFRSNSFFMGGNVRKAVAEGRGDNFSIFLHEIPQLFYKKIVQPDVALVHVSPPDRHGYCSLGTSVDCVRAALLHSKKIVGMYREIDVERGDINLYNLIEFLIQPKSTNKCLVPSVMLPYIVHILMP